jgi:thymidylate synthase
VEMVKTLLEREPKKFPTMLLDSSVTNLFAFRTDHFEIEDYDPHPGVKIAYRP